MTETRVLEWIIQVDRTALERVQSCTPELPCTKHTGLQDRSLHEAAYHACLFYRKLLVNAAINTSIGQYSSRQLIG
jgi:hypothetical protein